MLRQLPAVDQLLRSDWACEALVDYPRSRLVDWMRGGLECCRTLIAAGVELNAEIAWQRIAAYVQQQIADDQGHRIQHVINATGVLLHTNLGRAPLAASAIQRMQAAARYTNVELNLATGHRSHRGDRAARMLCDLVGCEDAIIVNNCAAATMLVLQAIANQREVIIARGQLVEIGGGFRLPDVFVAAGVVLREVGTTNRTYVRDYEAAVNEHTGAILRVHRSNFQQIGFVTEPSIQELVQSQRNTPVPVIDDLGSGNLYDLSEFGLAEPVVTESISTGTDLTLFSGDKLFGGPQCGMIVGRKRWIDKLRVHPMMRAMRCDKLTLAALEATIEIHLSKTAFSELPLLRMIALDVESIRQRCDLVCRRLIQTTYASVAVVACKSQIGGGSVPGSTIPSFAVKVTDVDAMELSRQLRRGKPAVQSIVRDDDVLLDLRTVEECELDRLTDCVQEALAIINANGN